MIPLRLAIKNFLCYHDEVPVLDLEAMHVVCLSGNNGHGKSALLDAITWNLWGQARGKSQDELIYQGEQEMAVELEFLARGERYRLSRRHVRSGRRRQGATDLQLQLLTSAGPRPLTGNSIRETEHQVSQLLGMDFRCFINSVYLVQGRADQFTIQSPAERKEVLVKILGLELYDRLANRARELARHRESRARELDGQITALAQETGLRKDYEEELRDTKKKLAALQAVVLDERREKERLQYEMATLQRRQQEIESSQRHLTDLVQQQNQLQNERRQIELRIDAYRSLLGQEKEIIEGFSKTTSLRRYYEELNQSQGKVLELQQHIGPLEQVIAAARVRLETELINLRNTIAGDLKPKATGLAGIREQLTQLQGQMTGIQAQENHVESQQARLQTVIEQIAGLHSLLEVVKTEGQEFRAKLNLLKHNENSARCPVCDTELNPDARERLANTYTADIQRKAASYTENQSVVRSLGIERDGLEQEWKISDKALGQAQKEFQSQSLNLNKQHEDALIAGQELAKAEQRADMIDSRLQKEEFSQDEQHQLRQFQGRLAALNYDMDKHLRVRQEIEALANFDLWHRQLEEARVFLSRENESMAKNQELLERNYQEIQQLEMKLHEAMMGVSELKDLEERMSRFQTDLNNMENDERKFLTRQGDLEGRVSRCLEIERAVTEIRGNIDKLQRERGLYQELAQAFGKDGVQAMLIESILPELESEANHLLGRMTDNRMHLRLETQRERRSGKGDPIETLEIRIADELGTRNYEVFSGGEAFRINLALRIALSKTLAHRSGAPLPTLFLDEGFGTQDAVGRERILEVIRAIQEDFQKIIVITHMDEIKEVFPVRIEVFKTQSGSTFTVV